MQLSQTQTSVPVSTQPKWMVKPNSVMGCPPGLEYLTLLDQLFVHQQVDLTEIVTRVQSGKKYDIKNSLGQQCYSAHESNRLERDCCSSQREYTMHVTDNLGHEVIRACRDSEGCVGCCCCIFGDTCAVRSTVEAPVGTPIGQILQVRTKWTPRYALQNVHGETLLIIQGPCCVCSGPNCTDNTFEILTADGQSIGCLSRQSAAADTNMSNITVVFPRDLDVKAKALLLGATFMIDIIFFEYQKNGSTGHQEW